MTFLTVEEVNKLIVSDCTFTNAGTPSMDSAVGIFTSASASLISSCSFTGLDYAVRANTGLLRTLHCSGTVKTALANLEGALMLHLGTYAGAPTIATVSGGGKLIT